MEFFRQIAISYSRGSSQPRDRAHVSSVSRQILYCCAIWEAHFIHNSVYMSIPISNLSHSPFAPRCPSVCSLCLCLYFYFANRFICTTFLDFLSLQANLKANYAIQQAYFLRRHYFRKRKAEYNLKVIKKNTLCCFHSKTLLHSLPTDDFKTASGRNLNNCEQLNREHHKERRIYYAFVCFSRSKKT